MAGQSSGEGLHAEHQVLLNRQLRNDLAPLGDVAHTSAGPLVGSLAVQGRTVKHDRALTGPQQTDQGLQQGGFSHPIAANQADHLPGIHGEIDIAQDVALAVIGVEPADLQQGGHGCSSSDVPR